MLADWAVVVLVGACGAARAVEAPSTATVVSSRTML